MTERQRDKLLKNHLVKAKLKVVTAVKQVFEAKVATDGASAVGEVKQLTVTPPILKVGSPLYNKDADKCKQTEWRIMKKDLVKVLTVESRWLRHCRASRPAGAPTRRCVEPRCYKD